MDWSQTKGIDRIRLSKRLENLHYEFIFLFIHAGSIDSLLTPFEVACNEAAAWLVRYRPALLLYRRELMELAKKAVRQSGFDFKHALPTAQQAAAAAAGHAG